MNRLENVTRQLEKVSTRCIVQTQNIAVQTSTLSPKKKLSITTSDSSRQDSPLSSIQFLKQQTIPNQAATMSISGYEDLLAGPVKEYLELSQKIGSDVAVHSKLVEKAFQLVAFSYFYVKIVKKHIVHIF